MGLRKKKIADLFEQPIDGNALLAKIQAEKASQGPAVQTTIDGRPVVAGGLEASLNAINTDNTAQDNGANLEHLNQFIDNGYKPIDQPVNDNIGVQDKIDALKRIRGRYVNRMND